MLLVLLMGSAAGPAAARGNEQMSREALATNTLAELAPGGGPGIQYVVTDKTGVLFEHSTGYADIRAGTPLSGKHTLAVFSMTKTLTAIAVLQLAERRALELEDRASRYIAHPYSPEITIRQLLSHTSGIPNPVPLRWVHLPAEHRGFDERAALDAVLAEYPKAKSRPGEEYRYSNLNYWLLGGIVSAVSGEDYVSYIGKNIFQRLRLPADSIGFVRSEGSPHAKGYLAKYSLMNLVKGFVTDSAVWGEYEDGWLHIRDVYVNGPSFGGAIGTAAAFGAILRDLLSERPVLLNDDGRRLLFSRQRTRSGQEIDMTLGWHTGTLRGTPYYYKEGGGAGFHAEMRMYPARGLASVIMTNRTSFDTKNALRRLDAVFLEQ